MEGIVTKSTGSWYKVNVQGSDDFQVRLPGKFKLENKKISNPIAVGDRVAFDEGDNGEFTITNIFPRENYVVRNSPHKRGHSHLIASNIDQAVLVASQKRPRTSLGFIDRFFVTLEAFRIPGLLLINKADLCSAEEIEALEDLLIMYKDIGYTGTIASLQDDGLGDLQKWFDGKTTLLSGHSGTGKSTLLNLLIPEAMQAIAEVSNFAEKGVHTTTFAEMFLINEKTRIIDTPGIKELGLSEIYKEELSHYFPEMREYLGQCKFHNCLHVSEPGCLIQEAVKSGKIGMSRFKSYLSMLEGEDNRK